MSKGPTGRDDRRKTSVASGSSNASGARKPPPRKPRRYVKPERAVNWYEKAEGQIAIASPGTPVDDDE